MTQQEVAVLLLAFIVGGEAQRLGRNCCTTNRTEGICVRIKDCPPIHDRLQEVTSGVGTQSSFWDVLRSFCSDSNLVCLALPDILFNRERTEPPSGMSLLPKNCGRARSRPVSNGPAPLGAWPWIVILNDRCGGKILPVCGGSLISERYVLTGSQCLKVLITECVFVRIGEYNLKENPDCDSRGCAPPPQDIPMERIIPYPAGNREADIGLIRLSRRVQMYEGFVEPICLPVNPTQDMGFSAQDFEGKRAWGAGWGDIIEDPLINIRPDVLVQLEVPIQTLPYCQSLKDPLIEEASGFCAGGEGNDFCTGDSGNPLTLTNEAGNRVFVIGIVSSGPIHCGAKDTQGLFTNVTFYIQWIISNLEP